MRILIGLLLAGLLAAQAPTGASRTRISWLHNHNALPGYGLVEGWDLTGLAAGTQSVPGLLSGLAALQLGSAASADTNDPQVTTEGLVFDGVDDWSTGTTVSRGTSDLTVMAVIKGTGENRRIWSSRNASALGVELFARATTGHLAYFYGDPSGFSEADVSATGITDGTWKAVAITFRHGVSAVGYINGIRQKTDTAMSVRTGVIDGGPDYVGTIYAAGSYWNGTIAYVATYNRALSDAEITQTYHALKRTLALKGVALP